MSYLNAKTDVKPLLDVEPAPDWLSIIIDGMEYVPAKSRTVQETKDIVTETFTHLFDAKTAIKNMEEKLAKYEKWAKERP
jgi:hypothetical protein